MLFMSVDVCKHTTYKLSPICRTISFNASADAWALPRSQHYPTFEHNKILPAICLSTTFG